MEPGFPMTLAISRRLHPLLVGTDGDSGQAARPVAGLGLSKFYDWRKRYGKVNEHNGWIPRDWWLEDWEKQAIIEFHDKNPT